METVLWVASNPSVELYPAFCIDSVMYAHKVGLFDHVVVAKDASTSHITLT